MLKYISRSLEILIIMNLNIMAYVVVCHMLGFLYLSARGNIKCTHCWSLVINNHHFFIDTVKEFHLESCLCVCVCFTVPPFHPLPWLLLFPGHHIIHRSDFSNLSGLVIWRQQACSSKSELCVENVRIATKRFREKCFVSRWASLPRTHSIKKITLQVNQINNEIMVTVH